MKKRFPQHPANPERLCWGCDKYCAADAMMCGNGSDRTQHPFELFGEDWRDWGSDYVEKTPPATSPLASESDQSTSASDKATRL